MIPYKQNVYRVTFFNPRQGISETFEVMAASETEAELKAENLVKDRPGLQLQKIARIGAQG